ncbi:methionine aminotransferase [Cesiribacter sp. SM1]|uniref:methionine aminotransferase n=1 Tax=Cesiribacter sp. SM1 TaxID=2861196 RepID=UPI001CD546E1|nr:methionine aminotransferase [Cesiribacter sp. SM1]
MPVPHLLQSKLPQVGTTIFTQMSALAATHGAINLSQGFPDFPIDDDLIERVAYYMRLGRNQYAPMTGTPQLRTSIAAKIERIYGYTPDAEKEITVTSGATEALYAVIAAVIGPGDEALVLDPAYDSYAPAVALQGGKPIHIPLQYPGFRPDWNVIRSSITPRSRLIIINTPHNPTGSAWQPDDLLQLEELVLQHKLLVLSDEVYQHLIYDGQQHQSVLSRPEIRKHAAAVFSFGKTFHATGWKAGYVVAPEAFSAEIRKVHQYLTFSTHTPTQLALADYLQKPENYEHLPQFYQKKHDLFLELLKDSRFKPLPCNGTYFQLLDYSGISNKPDVEMARWLTVEKGVAAIPISVFYVDKQDHCLLRFCFAKQEETLRKAAELLCKI